MQLLIHFCQQFPHRCDATVSPKQSDYCSNSSDVRLVEDVFGTFKNEAGKTETVRRFTLSNKSGMSVQIINYGATITKLNVPDRTGNTEDVVLGFDNVEGKWLCSYHGVVF
jgi:aldose 1-epimerase